MSREPKAVVAQYVAPDLYTIKPQRRVFRESRFPKYRDHSGCCQVTSLDSQRSNRDAIGWGNAIALLTVALSVFLALPILANAITVKPAVVGAEKLTVGDRFLYIDTVEVAPGDSVLPLPPDNGKLGDAEVVSQLMGAKNPIPGKQIFACSLAVYKPGQAKIPTFVFRKSSDLSDTTAYFGDTLAVYIASVLPADTAGVEMADIKGPRRLRGPIWPYLAAVAALALLLFAGSKLRKRFGKGIETPQAPPVPPWDLAMQRLDALKAERYLDFGRFKEFYFDLSLIVRGYIEGRYETPAVESTTYELEDNEKLKELPNNHSSRLFDFFSRADLVKFAKSIPTAKDAEVDISFAYQFVLDTKPAPAALTEKDSEGVKV